MKKMLVPSDFSDNSLVALTYAIELSKVTGASLAVFHCLLPSSDLVFASLDELSREQQAQKELKLVSEQLRNQVSEAYRKLGMTVPHSTQVGVEINPLVVEKIMDVALTQHADLIVMGTHGASGFRGRLFGSNTS
ncbi:MAG: universal stress protein, partial [Chitinophagaceae bacterium]